METSQSVGKVTLFVHDFPGEIMVFSTSMLVHPRVLSCQKLIVSCCSFFVGITLCTTLTSLSSLPKDHIFLLKNIQNDELVSPVSDGEMAMYLNPSTLFVRPE